MKNLFVFCLLISFYSYADACATSRDEIEINSAKKQHKFKLDTDEKDGVIGVSVEIPLFIDEVLFNKAYLVARNENGKGHVFLVPLDSKGNNDSMFVWFSIDSDLINNTYIAIDYGSACGSTLEYNVGKLINASSPHK